MWSVTMVGLGQFYKGQYVFGFVLLASEFVTNNLSELNLAVHDSFHGDFLAAHYILNYQWGLFYPSLYGFSIWQAYNKAIILNWKEEEPLKKFT